MSLLPQEPEAVECSREIPSWTKKEPSPFCDTELAACPWVSLYHLLKVEISNQLEGLILSRFLITSRTFQVNWGHNSKQ